MKARYYYVGEGRKTCDYCKKYMWPICIERGGNRPNFVICSQCGNKLEVKQNAI